jgi:hypothetical protein
VVRERERHKSTLPLPHCPTAPPPPTLPLYNLHSKLYTQQLCSSALQLIHMPKTFFEGFTTKKTYRSTSLVDS